MWQEDRRPETRGSDLFGRRVSAADGSLPGAVFRVRGAVATEDDELVSVVWNAASGEYLVVREYGDNRLLGRRVSAAGTPLGTEFTVANRGVAGAPKHQPEVAWNSADNEYLVVWFDDRAVRPHVFGRRLDG